jgi:ATP-dependent Clp protease adapter protein ClpS
MRNQYSARIPQMMLQQSVIAIALILLCVTTVCYSFTVIIPSTTTTSLAFSRSTINVEKRQNYDTIPFITSKLITSNSRTATTATTTSSLYMSSNERDTKRTTKKSVQTIDKVETKAEEEKKKEEMWRVVLHNDEVHTFNYVVRSLTKVIGTLDRKAAFEICVETHGIGKATITKTWKKQAEQFCLGLQRQGLTVSISPDEDFEGGHSGGGL